MRCVYRRRKHLSLSDHGDSANHGECRALTELSIARVASSRLMLGSVTGASDNGWGGSRRVAAGLATAGGRGDMRTGAVTRGTDGASLGPCVRSAAVVTGSGSPAEGPDVAVTPATPPLASEGWLAGAAAPAATGALRVTPAGG